MINYYIVKIEGKHLNNFINYLFRLNINILDIKYIKDKIIIKVRYNDYEKIKSIKTTNKISIIKVSGYKKIKIILKKYSIFSIFLFFSFFVTYLLFKITFFININGVDKSFKKEIINELKYYKVNTYSFDKSFNEYKTVANRIKNKYSDKIEWIEISNNGISINVDIIPRKKSNETNSISNNNIVAKKNGIIKNIVSTKGQVLKDREDYVKKGDVIVSGIIYRNNKPVDIINANGKVYAEVWYKVNLNSSYYINSKTIKDKKRNIYIKILGKNIKLISYKKNISNSNTKTLYRGLFFSLIKNDKIYYQNTKVKNNNKQMKEYLLEKAHLTILDTLNEDEKILEEKTLKIYNNNGKMYVEVFFKTYEDIAEEKEIKEKNIDELKEIEG